MLTRASCVVDNAGFGEIGELLIHSLRSITAHYEFEATDCPTHELIYSNWISLILLPPLRLPFQFLIALSVGSEGSPTSIRQSRLCRRRAASVYLSQSVTLRRLTFYAGLEGLVSDDSMQWCQLFLTYLHPFNSPMKPSYLCLNNVFTTTANNNVICV